MGIQNLNKKRKTNWILVVVVKWRYCENCLLSLLAKISLTSRIVINVPTRASLAVETKGLLFLWLVHLNNRSNVCKQISSLLTPQKFKLVQQDSNSWPLRCQCNARYQLSYDATQLGAGHFVGHISSRWIFLVSRRDNRPFYSCVLSYLAFEWKWGWSWPCFDRNLTAFLMLMMLFSC